MAEIKLIRFICVTMTLTMCCLVIPQVYEDNTPLVAGLAALFVSPIMMQVFAQAFEGRWLWPPRTQFNAFIYGETIFLPIVAMCEAQVYSEWSSHGVLSDWYGWIGMVLAFSLGIGVLSRNREHQSYTLAQMNSPTKLWHDLCVVPTLIFLLLFPLPALFYVPFGFYHLVACVAFVVWVVLMTEPGTAKKRNTAHIEYEWETESISARYD